MKAILAEYGTCPTDKQAMRRNAIAGAKVLVDLLADESFADLCTITLDYEGDGFTSVVEIRTTKWVPQYAPQNLQHIWPIDMSEAFGEDNIDNALLRQIVQDIKSAMIAEEEARDRVAARPRRIEV